MAFDAFLNFTEKGPGAYDIKGETLDAQFAGWFEIKEFSFGIENTLNITSASGGAGAGKAEFKEFTVKKQTDKASPYLAMTCGTGGHYQKVELKLRKTGASKQQAAVYLHFEFKLVAVKSINWSGSSGDDVPEEEVVFEYGALQVNYFPQDKHGTISSKAEKGFWSKTKNKAIFEV
jgi:type VI secretion system Hcp family effector